MLDETYTDAFLVLKDGVIITEDYRNGMAPDSLHLLNSVTKSFLGMLTGSLVEDGVIETDAPLTNYIPEFSNTAFRETTIQHALDMTASLKFEEDYLDRSCAFWQEAAVVGWRPVVDAEKIPNTLFDYAKSLKETEGTDGGRFQYRTILTNVLAMAIERASGERVPDLLEKRIWQKLGPEHDAAIVVDSAQFPYMGAGMNACLRDLGRFGQMILGNGAFNGEQIVPRAWIEDIQNGSDKARSLFAEGDFDQMLPGGHYRNQVWAARDRTTMICLGIHGQYIHVNQSTGVVSVKLSTQPEPAADLMFADTFLALDALSTQV